MGTEERDRRTAWFLLHVPGCPWHFRFPPATRDNPHFPPSLATSGREARSHSRFGLRVPRGGRCRASFRVLASQSSILTSQRGIGTHYLMAKDGMHRRPPGGHMEQQCVHSPQHLGKGLRRAFTSSSDVSRKTHWHFQHNRAEAKMAETSLLLNLPFFFFFKADYMTWLEIIRLLMSVLANPRSSHAIAKKNIEKPRGHFTCFPPPLAKL